MWRKNNQAQIRRQFGSQEGEIKASRNLKKKTDPLETASEAEKKKLNPFLSLHLSSPRRKRKQVTLGKRGTETMSVYLMNAAQSWWLLAETV